MKFLLPLLALLGFAQAALAKDFKIGVVDSRLIMMEYNEYRDNMRILSSEKEDWERELSNLEQELQAEAADYERLKNSGLTEVRAQEIRDRLQGMQANLEDKAREYFAEGSGKLFQREKELMEPLTIKINTAIQEVAEEYSYDLILDNSEQIVVYANENTVDHNLTEKVINKLEGVK